jgi:hypothetical protein
MPPHSKAKAPAVDASFVVCFNFRMTWHESVSQAIQRLTSRTGQRVFSRQELIESELAQIIAETEPRPGTPEQTLNRVLQELRTKGMLDVEAPDIYRVIT